MKSQNSSALAGSIQMACSKIFSCTKSPAIKCYYQGLHLKWTMKATALHSGSLVLEIPCEWQLGQLNNKVSVGHLPLQNNTTVQILSDLLLKLLELSSLKPFPYWPQFSEQDDVMRIKIPCLTAPSREMASLITGKKDL